MSRILDGSLRTLRLERRTGPVLIKASPIDEPEPDHVKPVLLILVWGCELGSYRGGLARMGANSLAFCGRMVDGKEATVHQGNAYRVPDAGFFGERGHSKPWKPLEAAASSFNKGNINHHGSVYIRCEGSCVWLRISRLGVGSIVKNQCICRIYNSKEPLTHPMNLMGLVPR